MRSSPLLDSSASRVCVHWTRPCTTQATALAPIVPTLLGALECQPEERALVMIDSALNKRLVTREQLRRAARGMPKRVIVAIARADDTSQSGIETLVRIRLRRLGIMVRTQAYHPGVGRVDLLVGDRLVIECDGKPFHEPDEASERDYDRDIVLVRDDRIVLRLRYRHIVYEWDRIEQIILEIVRSGRHRWPRNRVV
jgi:hypothetical protein